jgi:hypothetical protein
MPKTRTITPAEEARIREHFELDPGSPSGLTRRIRSGTRIRAGDHAGSLVTQGCGHQSWSVGLDRRHYKAHNIIWLLLHDQWPAALWPLTVDHVNRDASDNSHDNLRLATQSQQKANRDVFGASSYRYVAWSKQARKWRAQWYVPITNRNVWAGYHATELGAHCAALASRLENYDLLAGEFKL